MQYDIAPVRRKPRHGKLFAPAVGAESERIVERMEDNGRQQRAGGQIDILERQSQEKRSAGLDRFDVYESEQQGSEQRADHHAVPGHQVAAQAATEKDLFTHPRQQASGEEHQRPWRQPEGHQLIKLELRQVLAGPVRHFACKYGQWQHKQHDQSELGPRQAAPSDAERDGLAEENDRHDKRDGQRRCGADQYEQRGEAAFHGGRVGRLLPHERGESHRADGKNHADDQLNEKQADHAQ